MNQEVSRTIAQTRFDALGSLGKDIYEELEMSYNQYNDNKEVVVSVEDIHDRMNVMEWRDLKKKAKEKFRLTFKNAVNRMVDNNMTVVLVNETFVDDYHDTLVDWEDEKDDETIENWFPKCGNKAFGMMICHSESHVSSVLFSFSRERAKTRAQGNVFSYKAMTLSGIRRDLEHFREINPLISNHQLIKELRLLENGHDYEE